MAPKRKARLNPNLLSTPGALFLLLSQGLLPFGKALPQGVVPWPYLLPLLWNVDFTVLALTGQYRKRVYSLCFIGVLYSLGFGLDLQTFLAYFLMFGGNLLLLPESSPYYNRLKPYLGGISPCLKP